MLPEPLHPAIVHLPIALAMILPILAALSLAVLLVTAAGLWVGRVGDVARGLSVVLMLGLLVAGARVGHLGGELVYQHGAADAYVDPPASPKRIAEHD